MKHPSTTEKPVRKIGINDPYICKLVEKIRVARGNKSAAKTAGQLITERISELENSDQRENVPA